MNDKSIGSSWQPLQQKLQQVTGKGEWTHLMMVTAGKRQNPKKFLNDFYL